MRRLFLSLLLASSNLLMGADTLVSERPSNQWFEGPASKVSISPDGKWALFISWGQGAHLVSLTSGKEDTGRVKLGLDAPASDAVFCGKETLALFGKHGSAAGWFLPGSAPPQVRPEALMDCSADGNRIVYWFPYGESGLWVGSPGKFQKYELAGKITGTTFSSDDQSLYASVFRPSGETSIVRIRASQPGVIVLAEALDGIASDMVSHIALSSDERRLFVALVSSRPPDNQARHQPSARHYLQIHEIDLASRARRVVVSSPDHDDFSPFVAAGNLYWARNRSHESVALMPSAGGAVKELPAPGEVPMWSPDGLRISYAVGGWRLADWALDLDVDVIGIDRQGQMSTAPMPFITGYHEDFPAAWSPDGRWIAFHSHRSKSPVPAYDSPGSSDDVYLRLAADPHAPEIRLTDFGWETGPASWSPDGSKLLFASWVKGGEPEISKLWVLSLDTKNGKVLQSTRLPLAPEIRSAQRAAWSPDGRSLAIEDNRGGEERILWVTDTAGTHPRKLRAYRGTSENGLDWSPDGRSIVFSALAADGHTQLFAIPSQGGDARQLTNDSGNLMHPRFSPDGRWIACTRIVQSQQIWSRPLGQ